MLFDEVMKNPLVKKALETGEEQVGKVLGKLLASDGLTGGFQSLVTTARQARETLERGMSQALHAANLPSKDDVAALKRRLEELESMIDGLSEKVGGRGGGNGG
jgi:polyhydroxyalkanoate synthesis regulator phasin